MAARSRPLRAAELRFAAAGLIAVVALGAFVLLAVSRISTNESLRTARERAELAGRGIVEPALDSAILGALPEARSAIAALDAIVATRVLSERVARVKIWTADGRVVYSDETRLVGEQFAQKDDHAEALRTGATNAEVADTDGPENRFERESGRLLEVYLPVRAPDGTQLVYEQYERYDSVIGNARELVYRLAVPFGGGLVLLWLSQLPLARSLVRRVRSAEAQRATMLEHAITSSDRERERIAADLHDGVVQDMAGLAFELAATTRSTPAGPTHDALQRSAEIARRSMQRLRSSLVDLHPRTVNAIGLGDALDSLVEPLRRNDMSVELDVDVSDKLTDDVASLVYRVAQELLRNVAEHAKATRVKVTAEDSGGALRLTIRDNGIGFTEEDREKRRSEGHIGLDLQGAVVARYGGSLSVRSQSGDGTVAVLELPTRPEEPEAFFWKQVVRR